MAPPTLPGPDESQDDAQWRTAGDRIQALLDASAAGGAVARERAEQLVREVTDLYGAGLARITRIAVAANPQLADAFTQDDLVASLLLVHGLHPHDIERRVADALDSVRPYLGSHGGDVSLLEVDGDVVRLQFTGSCKSCPSSAVTLELAVEDAVRAAAPEISSIEVVAADRDPSSGVIPAESLLTRLPSNKGRGREEHTKRHRSTAWQPTPELAELAPGEVAGFRVADTMTLACRVGDDVGGRDGGEIYAYHDRCPTCVGSLAGAQLSGTVLRCPRCDIGFDVVHAGASVDGDSHLEPIPVLVRDGVPSMAIAETVAP
jgi:Fe-S cluster biogenesis protein NfuA/nitrite reductase/ring-hydroxylating ferredoxin subunit